MRPLKSLISLEQAHEILFNNLKICEETERIPLLELSNRVSAEEIKAEFNVPPFRRAAMDGYAVKASSTFQATDSNPIYLECIEEIHAGDVPTKSIDETQCMEIATGAMLPDSADCVVPVEYTNREKNKIEILKGFAPHSNVSQEGVDIHRGEIVIPQEVVFTPARIGVLAALNRKDALVYRKVKVAVIPTGREIAPLGSELKPGQVYDINTYTLTTLIAQHGGEPVVYDLVEDSFEALESVILDAVTKTDIVVIGGGSSVGERDINVDIIEKHGTVLFHGIQIRPGKPTLCGKIQDIMILNLPGYPTSCLTNGYINLLPVLRKMSHLPPVTKRKIQVKLAKKIVSRLGRHQIFTVMVNDEYAFPAYKESGAITSMALADGYIEIPDNCDLIDKNEIVEVTLF
ncbi:MAG: molybdenum cofactor synthesis domain-containing protein [Promethearchaeota archaeon]